jgi:hypothetical protein
LLKISTKEPIMATVNFSVPDHVKESFNRAFEGENKSAVIAQLMQQAIERRVQQRRRSDAIDAILALSEGQPSVSDDEIAKARQAMRP